MSSQPPPEKEKAMPSVMDQVNERIEESGAKPPKKKKPATANDASDSDESNTPSGDQKTVKVDHLNLRVPLSNDEVPSFRLHIDVNLAGSQAIALRRIATALDLQQATLANGRRCTNCNDAVRWVLEELSKNP